MVTAGVQSTPEIWLGISVKTQDIIWFSVANTSFVLGVMEAPENNSMTLTLCKKLYLGTTLKLKKISRICENNILLHITASIDINTKQHMCHGCQST